MGNQQTASAASPVQRAAFIRAVLRDLERLERMLEEGQFDGETRLGAEQEFALLDDALQPAPVGEQVLRALSADKRFTAEIGRCNLEANLTPRKLRGRCFTALRDELRDLADLARGAAQGAGAQVLLAGIAPSFDALHAPRAMMTPRGRYQELDRATLAAKGGRVPLAIQGLDSLNLWHDSVMLEAAATSFQVHLQVAPEVFAETFNCALLVAAPLLAACANSALFCGKRLWHETRVPLLELSGDIRTLAQWRRGGRSRTSLGEGWIEGSPVELLRRDLARFHPVVLPGGFDPETAGREGAQAGASAPPLEALTTFNSSVWRWVRACYGVTGGLPHLRIENRVLPAGPTLADQVANAAFWIGMMVALPRLYGDLREQLSFEAAEVNFHAAARDGLGAQLTWLDGERVTASELILEELLPASRAGLISAGVEPREVATLLDGIEERVRSGQTGAAWMLRTFEATAEREPPRLRAWRVARAALDRCWSGEPVHRWTVPSVAERSERVGVPVAVAVETDFIVLEPHAPVELAELLLATETTHVVVERDEGGLLGVLVAADLARWRAHEGPGATATLSQILSSAPAELDPSSLAEEVLAQMVRNGESCRVLRQEGHLAGLVRLETLRRLATGERPLRTLAAEAPADADGSAACLSSGAC